MKKAVVLLSGGLDSATTLAVAQSEGFQPIALTFHYGQRHAAELQAAERIAKKAGVAEHVVLSVDFRAIGGSALTDDIAVPKHRSVDAHDIPPTYVPARNTVFLSLALALAEARGARDLFIGVNALDYSGYPDCRPEFLKAFEAMANLATKAGVEGDRFTVHAPLLHMSKAVIIKTGMRLGVDYGLTFSCYDPSPQGWPCGACDACQLRKKGFQEAGVEDPAFTRHDRVRRTP